MLKSTIRLGMIVDDLQRMALEIVDELPDEGKKRLIEPLSALRIETNRIYGKLVKDEKLAESILIAINAAYLLGHHGAPSKNARNLVRRLQTSAARSKRNFHPDEEEIILAAIYKHAAGWDGHNPTEMSRIIAADLEGSVGKRTPRSILTRLKKLLAQQSREA